MRLSTLLLILAGGIGFIVGFWIQDWWIFALGLGCLISGQLWGIYEK